ncbi:NAD(P)/FAD-dependent oxidoreductase [Oricola sp.]|uniref:NAD(P)/FAD-dependent oxidoreductase n=1 Tax=Oricola sp. TaxID=1979950 RepID=UPI003BABC219
MAGICSRTEYDALIVGARVAGAATGMLLARAGWRVLIVDREDKIGDTLSTHALMRPAVMLLDAWGLLDPLMAAGTPVVRQSSFHYGPERIAIPIKPVGNALGLIAPRRFVLDPLLGEAATNAGAELKTGITFLRTLRDPENRIIGAVLSDRSGRQQSVRAGIVIGADGRRSRVAADVGAAEIARAETCAATLFGYFPGIVNTGYRWYFGAGTAGGAIPTNNGLHCVFAGCQPKHTDQRLKGDPQQAIAATLDDLDGELAEHVRRTPPAERPLLFRGAPGHIREATGPGWALVGDAGYFKDPATAHGITDAFLDAHRLAGSLVRGLGSAAYRIERDRHAGPLFAITHEIAGFDQNTQRLKALHLALNECMKREAEAIAWPAGENDNAFGKAFNENRQRPARRRSMLP